MPADPVLVLSALAAAHLVADFLLQSEAVATEKFGDGPRAWRALALHAAGVAIALLPIVVVFGLPGLAVLAVVTSCHVLIDRWKVLATRRAEARAMLEARARHVTHEPPAGIGPAWTPAPAALFAADQALHAAVIVGAWAVWLAGAVPLAPVASAIDAALGGWDRTVVQHVAVAGLVGAALLIVNVRAASFFVATLVHPREPSETEQATTEESASPARVGATIGVLERLLIVVLVLNGAVAAIGLVIAAKTLARFRQLDDRHFAEYYLLGTLASVSVALASGLVADLALTAAGVIP